MYSREDKRGFHGNFDEYRQGMLLLYCRGYTVRGFDKYLQEIFLFSLLYGRSSNFPIIINQRKILKNYKILLL